MKQILPYCSTWLQILSSSPSLLCCAGLHLPLLQFVVGWPWTWNNPLASVSQTLRLQFMCHWAWLFGLILESGPVSLSISCPLHIDINIIRTAARGTVVRSPFCTLPPFHTLKVSSHPHATSSSVPEPRERLDQCLLSLYLACGFTYSRLSWVPDHPRRLHACCLEPSSAQCWLHPHSSDCNSSEPLSRATLLPWAGAWQHSASWKLRVLMDLSHQGNECCLIVLVSAVILIKTWIKKSELNVVH